MIISSVSSRLSYVKATVKDICLVSFLDKNELGIRSTSQFQSFPSTNKEIVSIKRESTPIISIIKNDNN